MKEAFGGIFNFFFLSLFLVILIGIMGLIVSYTKAFKMKNIILSTVEEYEGIKCGNYSDITSADSACLSKIKEEAERLGFKPFGLVCNSSEGYNKALDLYCFKITTKGNYDIYSIKTKVDVHFPVVSSIFGFDSFMISGDSRAIPRQ